MEDGSNGTLPMSLQPDKKVNCIADENESNASSIRSTPSTSISNMANYPDNDLSEADNDGSKQQVQPEIPVNYQQVTTDMNGDFDLSMSPINDEAISTISANGKVISTDKILEKLAKEDEECDNTSDNDVLVIDEEQFGIVEDRNRDKKVPDIIDKSPEKESENSDKISKCTEDAGVMPEHSNPYFSESIFELLNKKASAALPKKKSSVNKSKFTQDRQSNKYHNDYSQYSGLAPPVPQMLKCARCNLAGFPTVTILNDHLIKCGNIGGFTSGITGNVGMDNLFNNSNGLHKKVFLCSTCGTYHTQADLFLHILHTHRRYVCLYCQGMFPGAERLARHLGNRHGACRYQKNHQEQQDSEQTCANNNALLKNGSAVNSGGQRRDESVVDSTDNSGKTFRRRYGNIQEFRKGYKEECYLVCCDCERVFGGGTGIRNREVMGEFDDTELERHVCELGNITPTLPSRLPQPTTPRTIVDAPIVEDNNALPTTNTFNPMETSHRHIVSPSNDNVQSLKSSSTDINNPVINAQIQSPVHSTNGEFLRDAMQDDSRDNDNGDNEDIIMTNKEDRSMDGIKDYHEEKADLQPSISPSSNTILQATSESILPDTRKVPKVTLKLTKPYQPHSDYSDSDSYLSDEINDDNNDGHNDGNDSSDSDKLTMQVDEERAASGTVADGDEQAEHIAEIAEDDMRLDDVQKAEVDVEERVDQIDNNVAQIDGGADEESTADGGKLSAVIIPDQSQQPAELTVAGNDVPVLELEEMLEQPLDKMEPQSLLRHILLTSVPHCLYCNHARVIPVEGRQLTLHALGEHRFSATVRSITAEELIPESFNARLRECIPELRGKYFNLLHQPPRDSVEGTEEQAVVVKGGNKVRFECFQCRYQTAVHKELYQHNRKLHSKALLLCIMCKTSFLHYSELICHLCPGIYDVAPLLEPPEKSNNQSSSAGGVNSAISSAHVHGATDEDTNQSGNVAGGSNNGLGGIAVPDIRFRCGLCTKDKIEPLEKKENSVWELPSAFRLMVHLRKKHHLCDVCMEPCNSQQKLANHVWKHKLNHFCYRCGIAYRNKADITKHLYWKHGTESADCRRCLLKRWPHVYHFCQPTTQFACDECTLTFSRAMCLRVHKRLHLSTIEQQKPYVCTWGAEQEAELMRIENGGENDESLKHQDINEIAGEDCKSNTDEIKIETPTSSVTEKSKIVTVCGQRFVSRKMLRKHEFKHREPKDDESEQIIVDEVDVSKEDITKVNELTDKETEEQNGLIDQKSDIPISKEEIEAEEGKVTKPKVDVYDLPALNLSESDSSDTEDETETKKGIVDSLKLKKGDVGGTVEIKCNTIESNELNKGTKIGCDVEIAGKTPVVDHIWENFKNYQKSQLDRQSTNPSPTTSGFQMDEEEETPILTDIAPPLTEELVLQDHDYCRVTVDTLIEQDPNLEDDNTQISSVDHDYCTGAKEHDEKKEGNEQYPKNEPGAPQSTIPDTTIPANSGSDSDTSSCTCGSNCSCSSSSSSSEGDDSSSSNDSSSDSSSSEGRRRQQAKREKKRQKKLISKGRKNSTNITTVENTSNDLNTSNIVDVVDVVKREPLIQESDLETTESETDEDFYEEQPQRFALRLLAEKREKLLQKVDEDLQMNGGLLGSRPVTPSSLATTQNTSQLPPSHTSPTTHSSKKSKKSKSKKKKKKASRRKRNRSKSRCKSSDINPSHLYAQQYQQHLQYQQLVQRQQMERKYGREVQQLQQQTIGVVAPITLSLKQTTVNTMYGTTLSAAVGGTTPGQMVTHGAANNMAAMGGSGSLYGQSGNSTPDDSNTRASKRRRVPNKFYGYSSDEEGNMITVNAGVSISLGHSPKWRKIDSPKRPRSPLVVPPITIKTIPPQITTQVQQPTIAPLRIQHKSSSSSHNRPPRQFHPPNSKYRQKSLHSTSKRIGAPSHSNARPPTLPSFHRPQHQHPQRPPPAPINNNDSSDDNDSSSDDDDDECQHKTIPQAPQVPIAPVTVPEPVQQPALPHRKGFSLQLQHQQQQRMLNSAVSIGAGVRRGPTGVIVGAGAAALGATPVPAPGVALYCYCRCPYDEVSEMIGCDSDECAIEWFHFECVGIMVPPKGQWFCPDCRKRKQQRREMQLQLQQQKHIQN